MPPTKQEIYLKELQNFCWDNGFNPEPMRNERLAFFAQLVAEKNESVNLISRKDVESIIENHISSLSISPNPTSNELNISLSKNSVSEIMVVDLQGKEKIKLTTKESFTKLDVNSLMNGVYLLVVKNPDVVYQEKFVVIK